MNRRFRIILLVVLAPLFLLPAACAEIAAPSADAPSSHSTVQGDSTQRGVATSGG